MRRALLIAPVLLLLICAASGLARAATNEIRFCGKSSKGREVTAGNYPQGNVPQTTCAFAQATNRIITRTEERGKLPHSFALRLRGQKLNCTYRRDSDYEEVRCRNHRRFVLLYRFL